MKYKLVAVDCDNTLLDSKGYIPQKNIDVINKLRDMGVNIVVATGRSDVLVKDYLDDLNLQVPVISCNGAALTDVYTKEVFYLNPINQTSVKKIFDYCIDNSILFKALTLECCYTNDPIAMEKGISQIVTKYKRPLKSTIPYEFVGDMRVLTDKNDILKTVIIHDNRELLLKYQKDLQAIENINVYRSGFNCIDMVALNASKGTALKKYAENMGIKAEEVIAFGDGENDLSMIEFAGMGVAMENGEQLLKEHADYITDTNDNCGVAKALIKFFNLSM